MTVKELVKELAKEKYDTKNTDVKVAFLDETYDVESVNIYDNEVHLKVVAGSE